MQKQCLTITLVLVVAWCGTAHSHGLPDFTALIEKSSPAVVKIDTVQTNLSKEITTHNDPPDALHDLFEHRRLYPKDTRSTGTGFLISAEGYVLTNYHVIKDSHEIIVRLIDRREYKARVVGIDRRSDLALLKIQENDLPYFKFAESGKLKVGEWVLAIGFPFDLDYSASVGIVSGIGRSIPTEKGENYVPFIQSDVAVNPGHSGGPLLNLDGEVVGINSQIFSHSGGSLGVSFAVPSSVASGVVEQLKTSGQVDRGWLGVYIQKVDRDLAHSLGLNKTHGALVAQVEPDSPADLAGILAGDVIIRLGDKDIVQSDDLPQTVGLMPPGSRTIATIIRKSNRVNLDVVIGSLSSSADPEVKVVDTPDKLGLIVGVVNNMAINSWRQGVIIKSVSEGSPASRAGLNKGDIIIQLNFNNIDGPEQYSAALSSLPVGNPFALRLMRNGVSMTVSLEIEH